MSSRLETISSASTRVEGARPFCSISSLKLCRPWKKRASTGRTDGAETNVPLPLQRVKWPSATSSPMAWRTVGRLMPISLHSSHSGGSMSPTCRRPSLMSARICSLSW